MTAPPRRRGPARLPRCGASGAKNPQLLSKARRRPAVSRQIRPRQVDPSRTGVRRGRTLFSSDMPKGLKDVRAATERPLSLFTLVRSFHIKNEIVDVPFNLKPPVQALIDRGITLLGFCHTVTLLTLRRIPRHMAYVMTGRRLLSFSGFRNRKKAVSGEAARPSIRLPDLLYAAPVKKMSS